MGQRRQAGRQDRRRVVGATGEEIAKGECHERAPVPAGFERTTGLPKLGDAARVAQQARGRRPG
jgi:hypothetical protein